MLFFIPFHQVQQEMGNEETYLNFLRCLRLFASNMISGSELLSFIEPFVVLVFVWNLLKLF